MELSTWSNITIIYRAGKSHGNADGLLRIRRTDMQHEGEYNISKILSCLQESNSAQVYPISLVEIDKSFREELKAKLLIDRTFARIRTQIVKIRDEDLSKGKDVPRHYYNQFILNDDLLYKLENGTRRLCIPYKMRERFLRNAHDQQGHSGIQRTYQLLRDTVFLPSMRSIVEDYVTKCLIYGPCKPSHYKLYSELQPIIAPNLPLRHLALDFVVALLCREG